MKITNRYTGESIHEVVGVASLREAAEAAVKAAISMRFANLRGANLSGADVPIVKNLDAQILKAISDGGGLEMGKWHTCDTTHCRAGWAITVAGDAGRGWSRPSVPALLAL